MADRPSEAADRGGAPPRDARLERLRDALLRPLSQREPVGRAQVDGLLRRAAEVVVAELELEVALVYLVCQPLPARETAPQRRGPARGRPPRGEELRLAHVAARRGALRRAVDPARQPPIGPGEGGAGAILAGRPFAIGSRSAPGSSLPPGGPFGIRGSTSGSGALLPPGIPLARPPAWSAAVPCADGEGQLVGVLEVAGRRGEAPGGDELNLLDEVASDLARLVRRVRDPGRARDEAELARNRARLARTTVVDPGRVAWDAALWSEVGEEAIDLYGVLPVDRCEDGLRVVMADPRDSLARSGFEAASGYRIAEARVAPEPAIEAVLDARLAADPGAEEPSARASELVVFGAPGAGKGAFLRGVEERVPEPLRGPLLVEPDRDAAGSFRRMSLDLRLPAGDPAAPAAAHRVRTLSGPCADDAWAELLERAHGVLFVGPGPDDADPRRAWSRLLRLGRDLGRPLAPFGDGPQVIAVWDPPGRPGAVRRPAPPAFLRVLPPARCTTESLRGPGGLAALRALADLVEPALLRARGVAVPPERLSAAPPRLARPRLSRRVRGRAAAAAAALACGLALGLVLLP